MSADTELRDAVPHERAHAPGDPAVAAPRSSRRRDLTVVVVALLAGMGLFAAFGALTGDDAPARATIDADVVGAPEPLETTAPDVPAGDPAPSPSAAVQRFLEAEAARDFDTSFASLSAAQRAQYASVASWTAAHADFLPVVDHEILQADAASVTTEVRYRSSLDEVVGLVPGRGRVTWPVVEEDGGWFVDFDAATVEPLLPADATADEAVAEWVATHQRCEEPVQYEGALVAAADLRRAVESLCDSSEPATTSPARPLDEFDASPFVSAFGTDALAWARAVEVGGPVDLSVVVAPVDDRWIVVGLLPPT